MTTKTKFEQAADRLAKARALNDEHDGKDMPADVAHTIAEHLKAAEHLTRAGDIDAAAAYLSEPQYKHSPTDYGTPGGELGADHSGPDAWSPAESKTLTPGTVKTLAGLARGRAEAKAALVEDATGEMVVPHDFAGLILTDMARQGVIRPDAWVRPTTRRRVDLGALHVAAPSWGVLELGDTPADGLADPPVTGDQVVVWDLNALVKIGRDELEDTDAGLVEMIRQAVAAKFTEAEDLAFTTGAGDTGKRPQGFATPAAGITQKVTAAAPGTVVADDLLKLTYRVPGWARSGGKFYAHSSLEEAVSLLKDADGRYLWQPATGQGNPASFRGYPWHTADGLPAYTADATVSRCCYFGNLTQGYMIADRRRVTVDMLRERFIVEGKVGMLFTHRVGGKVVRPNALAYLEV